MWSWGLGFIGTVRLATMPIVSNPGIPGIQAIPGIMFTGSVPAILGILKIPAILAMLGILGHLVIIAIPGILGILVLLVIKAIVEILAIPGFLVKRSAFLYYPIEVGSINLWAHLLLTPSQSLTDHS